MQSNGPWVLGLSASHNGSACLVQGNRVVAAVQQERLYGVKRARLQGSQPAFAVNYCLQQAGISPRDLDMVVLCAQTSFDEAEHDLTRNPQLEIAKHGTRTLAISHHMGHAISAFALSGFEEAAVLVVDGMGSPHSDLSIDEQKAVVEPVTDGWETTSLYRAKGPRIRCIEKHLVANGRWLDEPLPGSSMRRFGSLGGMYSAVAQQIFGDTMEAGKVMGLAPYGRPTTPASDFFEMSDGRFVYSDAVPRRFTGEAPWPDNQDDYQNLASSVQVALEDAILDLARRLRERTDCEDLVYAGGVALNCVANERIIRELGFKRVFILPAAEDSGPALGAAYYGLWTLGHEYKPYRLHSDALGRSYAGDEVRDTINKLPGLTTVNTDATAAEVADLLADNQIIGWFEGGSEFGPRALGNRSILCDPRSPDAKDRLNRRVKHREPFRPFGATALLEAVPEWFDVDGVDPESPFMLRILDVKDDKKALVPAIVHVDGSARLQTVTKEHNRALHELLEAFNRKTGVPIIVNTSFNVKGDPIVETPEDALVCLLSTDLDYCVFGSTIVRKADSKGLMGLVPRFSLPASALRRIEDRGRLNFQCESQTRWGPITLNVNAPEDGALMEAFTGGLLDGTHSVAEIEQQLIASGFEGVREPLLRLLGRLRRFGIVGFH